MSLEAALAANTAALIDNTAALLKSGGGDSAKARTAPADAEIDKVAAAKVAADKKKAAAAAATKKGPTIEKLAERLGAYMGVEDKKERKARIAQVAEMTEHFGVKRMGLVTGDQIEEALDFLSQLEAGEDPAYGGDGDAGDDDGAALV